MGVYQILRREGLTRNDIKKQYPQVHSFMVLKQGMLNYPSPGGRTGGPIPTTVRSRRSSSAPPFKRETGSPRRLFPSPSRSANGKWGPKGPKGNKGNKGNKGSPAPAPAPAQVIPAKSLTTRYKKLKEKLKAIQSRGENNARELRQLIKSQQNNLLRQIRERNTSMHRYSRIQGYPTNYYSPNTFSRYYRMPPIHRGLAQYYYYERPGVPRYVQQLPAQVWRINQGGRGLPPVPFYPTRRQARRARRWGR